MATLEATNTTLSTSLLNGPRTVSFHANPCLGNINPSSSIGSKFWKEDATSARDPQMNLRVKNAHEVMTTLKAYSASFGWGPIVNKISVTIKDGSSKDCNIFRDHKHIKFDDVQISTCPIFYDAAKSEVPPADFDMIMFDITLATDASHKKIFYKQVRAGLIGLKNINSLTRTTALSNLEVDKKKYTWTDSDGNVFYDGAVILQLIMQHIHNPNLWMTMDSHPSTSSQEQMRCLTLGDFTHLVAQFLYWTQDYKVVDMLQSGNQDLELESILVILHVMLDQLH